MSPDVRKKLEKFGIDLEELRKEVRELKKKIACDDAPRRADDRPEDPPPGDPGG